MIGTVGNLFLGAGLLFSLTSAATLLLPDYKKKNWIGPLIIWVSRLSMLSATLAISVLAYLFLNPDFGLIYIFDRASVSTPWIYRLSAMWAGQAGTFLMWGWVILLAALYINENMESENKFINWVVAIAFLGGAFFLFMTLQSSPFAPTMNQIISEASEAGVPVETVLAGYERSGFYQPSKGFIDGIGLNPMLQTPYNALHPPLMFIGYGLVFIVFAASIVYLITGKGDWEALGRPWALGSWLFMTAAMAIGGLWAYEELAFGGYWTWDPIEAASILPWLTLTAYIHGSIEHKRRGKMEIVTLFLGVLTTLLIVYSTYITRSGIIKSSHSYARTASADYLILAVAVLTAIALFFSLKRVNRGISFNGFSFFSQSTLLQLAVIGIFSIAAVVFWGLTDPVIAKVLNGLDVVTPPAYYNKNGYIFTLFVVFIAGVCSLLGFFKKSVLLKVSTTVLGLALIFYVIGSPTSSPFANALIPISLFALAGLLYKTIKTWNRLGLTKEFLRKASSDMAHLGIVLVVVGAVASGSFTKNFDMSFDFNMDRGKFLQLDHDFSVRLDDVKVFQDSSGNWVQDGYITLVKDAGVEESGVLRMVEHRHTPFIVRGISDVYGVFFGVGHQAGRAFVFFNFKIIPLVNLIWFGVVLLIVGMIGALYLDVGSEKSDNRA